MRKIYAHDANEEDMSNISYPGSYESWRMDVIEENNNKLRYKDIDTYLDVYIFLYSYPCPNFHSVLTNEIL